jgi:hypothetical protein
MVFSEPLAPGAAASSLDQRQLQVLESLASTRHFWGIQSGKTFMINANAGNLMHAYGLPSTLEKLEAFLRVEQS